MNHKLKRKWIAALRGGTWTQVFGSFGDREEGNKRCAVSVLTDIMDSDGFTYNDVGARASYAMILNDEGKSFNEIADWIEENL